jgi:hypothetical protein
MENITVNEKKVKNIEVDGKTYERYAIKTHVITEVDDICDVAEKYAKEHLTDGDILFITEKAVGCTQGRAIPMKDIHPRKLAVILSKFVLKTPYGIGLGIPETMEMALRECGTPRILFAAGVSAFGKIIGKRGWFYKIAGEKARSIDGPCDCTLPPYNECVSLSPLNPDDVCKAVSERVGTPVLVTDINDLGGVIMGAWPKTIDRDLMARILKDNPLGQSHEQTPMGIIREVK